MNVAAICAFPIGFNYGMVSVDLALEDFLMRCDITPTAVTRFLVEEPPAPLQVTATARLEYEFLDDVSQLDAFDLIIIWGDFLNSWQYFTAVSQRIVRRSGGDPDHEMDRLIRLLLLADASRETLERTVIFGGCLLPNRIYNGSPAYRAAIRTLYSAAICVAPRDPVSYREAWHLSGGATHVVQGMDAAFYFNAHEKVAQQESGELLWSWSRTMRPRITRAIRPTARRLFKAAFANRVRVYAGHSFGALSQVPLGWSTGTSGPIELIPVLEKMHCAAIVVTDTYHATVSAIARGVPVLCVGVGGVPQHGSLNDKKKELLLGDLGLQDLYVYWEELLTNDGRVRVRAQIDALARTDLRSLITERVARTMSHRTETIARLLSAHLKAGG